MNWLRWERWDLSPGAVFVGLSEYIVSSMTAWSPIASVGAGRIQRARWARSTPGRPDADHPVAASVTDERILTRERARQLEHCLQRPLDLPFGVRHPGSFSNDSLETGEQMNSPR